MKNPRFWSGRDPELITIWIKKLITIWSVLGQNLFQNLSTFVIFLIYIESKKLLQNQEKNMFFLEVETLLSFDKTRFARKYIDICNSPRGPNRDQFVHISLILLGHMFAAYRKSSNRPTANFG